VLAGHVQAFPARRQHDEVGAGGQEAFDQLGCGAKPWSPADTDPAA
jgi:hypothetical protein